MLFHPCPFVCWLVSQMDYRNQHQNLDGGRVGAPLTLVRIQIKRRIQRFLSDILATNAAGVLFIRRFFLTAYERVQKWAVGGGMHSTEHHCSLLQICC